jgi:hypothetical protein
VDCRPHGRAGPGRKNPGEYGLVGRIWMIPALSRLQSTMGSRQSCGRVADIRMGPDQGAGQRAQARGELR